MCTYGCTYNVNGFIVLYSCMIAAEAGNAFYVHTYNTDRWIHPRRFLQVVHTWFDEYIIYVVREFRKSHRYSDFTCRSIIHTASLEYPDHSHFTVKCMCEPARSSSSKHAGKTIDGAAYRNDTWQLNKYYY